MKATMLVCAVMCGGGLVGETADEAYARLAACRSVWETNAVAYARSIRLAKDLDAAAANGMWFVDAMSFPDVTDTNRLSNVLYAKEKLLLASTAYRGVMDNTNCWNALADYIARLKSAADPRWIDGSYYVVTDVLPDGSTIGANTNPLLNFASYKLEHYENYRQSHTNFVNETDAHNAFAEEWSNMVRNRQNRERALERAQRYAKHIMRDRFWLFGAKDWPSDVKAACRSNMVSRAHLTADEERYIFDEVPDWYYKVMGIKRK